MIYSGVDLIRKSEEHVAKTEKFSGLKPVSPADTTTTFGKDPDPSEALLRFARFLNKENKKKRSVPVSQHPYMAQARHQQNLADIGQMLDIYA